jgi:hypothetical protein
MSSKTFCTLCAMTDGMLFVSLGTHMTDKIFSSTLEANWEDSESNFPRKQMRRKNWVSLNGQWDFCFDDNCSWNKPQDVGNWNKKIIVPYAPESKASGIGDTKFHQRCWYQKKFILSEKTKSPRLLLHFGAVDYESKVWLNGIYLGCHLGGHTPFSFDITDALNKGRGEEQILTVCAYDDPHDLTKPRGKQDWQLEPHNIWYPRTTGIWQTVWLEGVPDVYIDRIGWVPLLERWEIGSSVFLSGSYKENLRIRIKLSVGGKLLADDTYQVIHQEVHRRIVLSDPGIDDFRNELLWSPEKPTLIDAQLEVWDGDTLVDRVSSYTALRSVSVQRGRFLLNGRPYYMRLVLDQGYWAETLMTPPNADSFKTDIELVKAAGFNGVRKHQKIEDPDYLYWADVLGLLVWEEMPSAYRFSHESVERLMKEWIDIIDRDSNHPCIVVWVPFNESWGVPDLAEKTAHQNCVQAMYHLTRTLDPTRPVIGNDGWESTATDILGIHDYDHDPDHMLKKYSIEGNLAEILSRWPGGRMLTVDGFPHRGQPIMLTEFGGIAYIDPEIRSANPKENPWGYSVSDNLDEFQKKIQKLFDAINQIELFSGFCYTQFTDTFQEANGLFRMDRTPKLPVKFIHQTITGTGSHRGGLNAAIIQPSLLQGGINFEPPQPL